MRFARSVGRSTKALPVAPTNTGGVPYPVSYGREGLPYHDGWDIQRAVDLGYLRVTWAWRAVNAIASNQAKLPMMLRKGHPTTGKAVENDSLLDVFNFKSSPYEAAYLFRKRLSQVVLLNRQGAFIEVVRAKNGDVLALYLLPPGWVRPIPDARTFVSGYRLQLPGLEWRDIPPDKVIWIRDPHPVDPYAGVTPMEAAGLAIEGDWYAKMFQRNFLLNDGRPGGILVVKGEVDPEVAQELQRRFLGPTGSGLSGAGRVTVMESETGADFVDTAQTPRDAQYVEMRREAKKEILVAFGVPETVAGDASGRTFSNADAELETFWRETQLPHLMLLARQLDDLTVDPRLFLDFDTSDVAILERDDREQAAFKLQELEAGGISRDEYRKDTGREPVGASRIYVTQGLIEIADTTDKGFAQELKDQADAAAKAQQEAQEQGALGSGPAPAALPPGPVPSGAQDEAGGGGWDPGAAVVKAVEPGEVKIADADRGVMVALYPSDEVVRACAVEGGETADDMHVTLAYLGKTGTLASDQQAALRAAVAAFAAGAPAMTARLAGVGRFDTSHKEGGVWWAAVDCPNLAEVRSRLVAAIEAAGLPVRHDHGFAPHMTLRYDEPGDVSPEPAVPEVSWPVTHLTVMWGGERSDHRLAGGEVPFTHDTKSLVAANPDAIDVKAVEGQWLRRTTTWEKSLAALLARHFDREARVVVEKLQGRKTRERYERHLQHVTEGKVEGLRSRWDLPEGSVTPVRVVEGKAGIDPDAVYDVDTFADQLKADVGVWLASVYQDFGEDTMDALGVDVEFDTGDPKVARLIKAQVNRLVGVENTTYDKIKTALAHGEEAGDTIPQLADRVKAVFADASDRRARTIARTEVIGAANTAAHQAAVQSGVATTKTWLAIDDHRTRLTHHAADRQTVGIGDKFTVGTVKMDHPGDVTAPPSETIQCRCVAIYGVDPLPDAKAVPLTWQVNGMPDDIDVKHLPGRHDQLDHAPVKRAVKAWANDLLDQARQAEPRVTRDMSDAVGGTGGELVDLDKRLKPVPSIVDRMRRNIAAAGARGRDADPAKAAEGVPDVLRYTVLWRPEQYTDGAETFMDRMKAAGYRHAGEGGWANAWGDTYAGYRGFNLRLESPGGTEFEVQLHSTDSYRLKATVHTMYKEAQRLASGDPDRAVLLNRMRQEADRVDSPPGAERLRWPTPARDWWTDLFDSRAFTT